MCGLSVKESMAQLYTEELCALAASIWLNYKSDHTQYEKEGWRKLRQGQRAGSCDKHPVLMWQLSERQTSGRDWHEWPRA